MSTVPDFSLKDRIAVITGGKGGMGKAIALCFAAMGADIALCDLDMRDGQLVTVAGEVEKLGRRSLAMKTDVSVKLEVDDFVNRVIEKFSAIDVLVNCAGIMSTSRFLDMPEDEWDRVVDVDLKSIYLCCQAVGTRMVERKKGSIINIASEFGLRGARERSAYCAAKAGVINLTRAIAMELAQYHIRVNAIAPGVIKTPLSWRRWQDKDVLKQTEAKIPLGRMGQPEEIAAAALFLASDVSSYVTGHTLSVDGGGYA